MKSKTNIDSILLLALACAMSVVSPLRAAEDDQAAIASVAEAFVGAFDKGDAQAVAAFWTPDGDYVDQTGRLSKGAEEIEKAFSQFFAENRGLKLGIESESLRFPTPDTAIEDGVSSVLAPNGMPPSRARYTNVFVKKDGKWLLSSVREAAYRPSSNAGYLRGLEWAIGEWVDEADGPEIGHVSFQWSPEGNFIVSTQAVTLKDVLMSRGTQWIGWDPATQQVRSWSFESDGGFSEGTWAQDGAKWVIKTNAVLPDGKKLSATNIVTRTGDDAITWQSTGRTLDGKSLPDLQEVKLKRVPLETNQQQ